MWFRVAHEDTCTMAIHGHPWPAQEEDDIDGAVSYARFRVDAIPARQAGTVGNTLRRTLLRQD